MRIQIDVDPKNSSAKIASTESGLQRVEDQAKKTQQACDSLGGTFKRIADYEKFMAAETRKAQQAVDALGGSFARVAAQMAYEAQKARAAVQNLGSGFAQVARQMAAESMSAVRGFDGMAEAIRREQAVLESIHGPMRQYMQDVETLASLQRRGAITAKEHAEALARSRSRNGIADPSSAVSLSMPAGRTGALAGAGSGLGALPAVAAGGFAAREVLSLSDSYTSLENRLRQVAGSQGDLNSLMGRTREIADATRSDWGATAESFVRLTNATKQMGLSQERALKITETLNMALQSSGASSSEAAAGTLQLMQALASGALQGDEFRSIAEQLPDLLDIFAKEMGVSRGELKKLGAEGKITADVVVRSLEAASGTIRDKFNASTATASQQWTVLKNQLTESAGEFVRNSGVMNTLSSATRGLSTVINVAGKGFGMLKSAADALGGAFDLIVRPGKMLTDAIGDLVSGDGAVSRLDGQIRSLVTNSEPAARSLEDIVAQLSSMHRVLSDGGIVSVEQFTDRMSRLHAELSKKADVAGSLGWFLSGGAISEGAARIGNAINDPWGGGGAMSAIDKWIDDFARQKKQVDAIQAPLKNYAQGIADAQANLAANRITTQQFIEELARLELAYDRADKKQTGFVKGAKQLTAADLATSQTIGEIKNVAEHMDYLADKMKVGEKAVLDLKKAFDEVAAQQTSKNLDAAGDSLDTQLEAAKKTEEQFKKQQETLQRLNDETMSQLKESALSFGDALVDSIDNADWSWKKFFDGMARDMVKQSFRGLINLGINAIGGGRTGFDAMVPGGMAPFLPGFRTGGDMLVGGSGAPDSKIAAFRVSPGETLHVRTPEQRRAAERSRGGSNVVNIYVPGERNRVLEERQLDGAVVRVIERHRGAIGPRLN